MTLECWWEVAGSINTTSKITIKKNKEVGITGEVSRRQLEAHLRTQRN